jgi:hypothetical protein
MLITQLIGGLGNQMFQYALGRSIALTTASELKLDVDCLTSGSSVSTNTPRTLRLDACNVVIELADATECELLKYGAAPAIKKWWCHLHGKPRPYGRNCYQERGMGFDKRMLHITGDAYIMGYWQSYKYFEDFSHILQDEFMPRDKLSPSTTKYLSKIKASNAVSIHVRRGDYVSNPTANAFHGTCDLQYYRRAIEAVEERVTDPRFFIFSDDLEWAKANLNFVYPAAFVEFTDRVHEVEEIHLMGSCQHNIIANSSFSWWGAWLNDNPHRMVVAPKQWFRNPKINTSDLIPPDWLRL